MFTGIVKSIGRVTATRMMARDMCLEIDSGDMDLDGCSQGDSILVSGVCLTMVERSGNRFAADVSAETLELTSLGSLVDGDPVNLELALTLSDSLGGHLVTGHVDGLAVLVSRTLDGRAERFSFEVPAGLARYIATKGSVCLDGTSLTVNSCKGRVFSVCLIPHTLEVTSLGTLAVGDKVNLEVDLLARYVERLNSYKAEHETPNKDPNTMEK